MSRRAAAGQRPDSLETCNADSKVGSPQPGRPCRGTRSTNQHFRHHPDSSLLIGGYSAGSDGGSCGLSAGVLAGRPVTTPWLTRSSGEVKARAAGVGPVRRFGWEPVRTRQSLPGRVAPTDAEAIESLLPRLAVSRLSTDATTRLAALDLRVTSWNAGKPPFAGLFESGRRDFNSGPLVPRLAR